jgi:hypothetical protein
METLYPAFDIVTLSSAFAEALPMVLGEAMAWRVPCVATDSCDALLLIGDTGAVGPRRDPEARAAAWGRLIEIGPDGRRALGQSARTRIVEHYDLDQVVHRFEALYDPINRRASATPRRLLHDLDPDANFGEPRCRANRPFYWMVNSPRSNCAILIIGTGVERMVSDANTRRLA